MLQYIVRLQAWGRPWGAGSLGSLFARKPPPPEDGARESWAGKWWPETMKGVGWGLR